MRGQARAKQIGEETGELDGMLGKFADFYEDEVDSSIQSLTSIIERRRPERRDGERAGCTSRSEE